MSLVCNLCDKVFSHHRTLQRHLREHHASKEGYRCHICKKMFKRRYLMSAHVRKSHLSQTKHRCHKCNAECPTSTSLKEHYLSHSVAGSSSESLPIKTNTRYDTVAFIYKHVSRFSKVKCLTLSTDIKFSDLWMSYTKAKTALGLELASAIQSLQIIKFDLILKVEFAKATDYSETTSCYFHSRARTLSSTAQISSNILDAFSGLNKQVEDHIERGSVWILQSIDGLDAHLTQAHKIKGATYLPLPSKLFRRKAIINVRNKDNRCFMWSILASLHPKTPKQHPNRVCNYKKYEDELDFTGISFPVAVKDIAKFELQNDLSINVYGYSDDEAKIKILHLTTNPCSVKQISLLLYNNQHYCLIKHPARLLYREKKHQHRLYQCHKCLNLFHSLQKRDNHFNRYTNPDLETCQMPEEDVLKFKNYHRMQRLPYVIYADFECILEKVNTVLPDPATSYTTTCQKHTACGYAVAEVFGCCSDATRLGETKIYRGQETVQRFLETIITWGERFQDQYNNQVPCDMTTQDWWQFYGSSTCSICQKPLDSNRVADHCHFCGSYRGACHSLCNVKHRLSRDVDVIFHNLRRYDSHLILQQLGHLANQRKGLRIKVIPKGFDDYLTFSIQQRYRGAAWNLKFVDSYQFLNTSLATLVDNLRNKNEDGFNNMKSYFAASEVQLLLRKGVYPYDYMDSWERFEETTLPPMNDFRNSLADEDISIQDYEHAVRIWKIFNCKQMGDYHDLYLITDVLLLADVFESFRFFCLLNYQLDPAHYFTSPLFSWDACLKLTEVELELFQDPEMYTFMEAGIRGGVSIITHPYAKANNPLLCDYNPGSPTSYIMYYNANNLYGWTMTCPLPLKDFSWVSDIDNIDVTAIPDDAEEGLILEVDLDYPDHLHDPHNDYPLATERMLITEDKLSPYCQKLKSSMQKAASKVSKLVPGLAQNQNYIVHYRNLKQYLSLGLKVTRIHRVLKFQQRPWMAPYINFNTEKRKEATSKFEKDLFKLFNNSVFGKTMENVRRYIDIKLVSTEEKVVKLASETEYNGFKVLSDSLWAVKMKRTNITLNKPIYIGFTVLDLSKMLMYDFHYNYITAKYGDNAKLLFTDTDSLCYLIQTKDIYSDMKNDCNMYDCSDYPKDHMCYNIDNKKVMGKFKDELNGIPIREFVGLRAKMYSLLDAANNEKKRAKGVKKMCCQ